MDEAIERVDGMQIGEKTVGVGGFLKRSDREKPVNNTFTNAREPVSAAFAAVFRSCSVSNGFVWLRNRSTSEVYIKNFPNDWDEDTMKTEFGKCGTALWTSLT